MTPAIATPYPRTEAELERAVGELLLDPALFGAEGPVLVHHQVHVPHGIIDILVETPGRLYIVELKHGPAKPHVIEQVTRYAHDFRDAILDATSRWTLPPEDRAFLREAKDRCVQPVVIASGYTFNTAAHFDHVRFMIWTHSEGALRLGAAPFRDYDTEHPLMDAIAKRTMQELEARWEGR